MPKNRTKLIVRILLFTGTAISLFFVPWILVKAWIKPLPKTIQEQVNAVNDYGLDGMIAYVDVAGQPPGFYAAGWNNRAEKIPADPHLLFKIASIGKLYVAAAITKLVAAGQVSLDSSLGHYMPELVGRIANAERISIRQLVGHRSGIKNYSDTPDYWKHPPQNSSDKLKLILDQPADFTPGESYAYSNTNYLLLAQIITRVTGNPSFAYIREKILLPLGLTHTFKSIHDVKMDSVLGGYYVGIKEDIKTEDYGSILATPEDVGIFLRALNDGSLFSNREQKIYSSIYVYNHTGLVPGYQNIACYYKDIDAVVVQCINTTNFEGYEWNLGEIFHNRIVKILRKQNAGKTAR